MINTQIKSHWKLAGRTFIKAVKVSLSIAISSVRATIYSIKVKEGLLKQRRECDQKLNNAVESYFENTY